MYAYKNKYLPVTYNKYIFIPAFYTQHVRTSIKYNKEKETDHPIKCIGDAKRPCDSLGPSRSALHVSR